jgi:tryptophan synthase alpha subunit
MDSALMSDHSFIHLHCHSHYSLLDGASSIDKLLERVQSHGMNALALTDHGNLHGALEFYRKAKAVGVNPIISKSAGIPSQNPARRLKDAGATSVMPAGSPIGSGQGILNPNNIRICLEYLKEGDPDYPVIVDAGVGTASDVAEAMELGVDGVFVGSGIFKSGDPAKRAAAIVKATTHYQDAAILAEVSRNLGEPMVGRQVTDIPEEDRIAGRGW